MPPSSWGSQSCSSGSWFMNSCPRNWEHAHRQHRLLLLVQNRYHYFAVAGAWSQRPASISNYSRRCPCSARQNLRLVVRTSKNQQVAIDLWRWTFCLLLLVRANAHRPRHHGSAGDATCCTATSQKGRLGSGDPSTTRRVRRRRNRVLLWLRP